MKHQIEPLGEVAHVDRIHLFHLKTLIARKVCNVVPRPGDEVVDGYDGVAQVEESITQMGANESAPASNQSPFLSHVPHLPHLRGLQACGQETIRVSAPFK